jgi:hypothetical protein
LYFNKKAKTNSLIKLCLNTVRSVFILVDILIVFISFFTKIFVNIKWKPLNIRVPYFKKNKAFRNNKISKK